MPRKSRQEPRGIAASELLKSEDKKGIFSKCCVNCHKTFTSNARGTRFCSSDCQKKYAARINRDRKRYREIAPVERIRVSAHNLAVKTYEVLVDMGLKPKGCCHCHSKGVFTEVSAVHHKDLNWLNNSPANLEGLCDKHHSAEHSRIEKEQNEKGLVMDEFYSEDFLPLARVINKDSDD